MRFFILIIVCSFLSFRTFAQISMLPKSIKIDLANPKAPEYKKRYKENKDSVNLLAKLNRRALRSAVKEMNDMPVKNRKKTQMTNLHRNFKQYRSMVAEVDSCLNVQEQIRTVRKNSFLNLKKSEEEIALKKRIEYQSVEDWIDDRSDIFIFPDSGIGFSEKINIIITYSQYDDIEWQKIDIDPVVFLDDYSKYGHWWHDESDPDSIKNQEEKSEQDEQIAMLTDKYFGGYQNYQSARQKIEKVETMLTRAQEYEKKIGALIKGDDKLIGALAARAMKLDALKEDSRGIEGLKKADEMTRRIEEMRRKVKQDRKEQKEQLTTEASEKGKELASKYFEGQEDKLATAQESLRDYKKGVFNIRNADNIEVLNKNSLKGRPLAERLFLGGYLQVSKKDNYAAIDFSPQLGYKWNKNYLWGIGGTYRFKLHQDKSNPSNRASVYGVRFFMEYDFNRLFAHGEYESISHAKLDLVTDSMVRINSPGALFGLGWKYNFIKNVNGNIMLLYNFLHDRTVSPYNKPFVFRFGFALDN